MKRHLPASFFFVLCVMMVSLTSIAQANKERWTKSKIKLDPTHTIKKLAAMGFETDHGDYKPGVSFTTAFSENQLSKIKSAGFEVEVLVNDVVKDLQLRNARVTPDQIQQDPVGDFCSKVKQYRTPKNWKLGSMGGHLRYEEMLLHLDSMRIKFPNLVSVKSAIDTTKTHEGRTIWSVRISDNPTISEPTEPQALFSSVHHAREPVGMHQLIFFMWYLLENYNSNDEIKALVNGSELYFVPCVNPDGYIFNQTQEPNGGGMWRKNRRDNLDGTFGVDLNRNYGYNWGYDDFGSSGNPESDTYRGTEGFSEPETRAMKAFCENHTFKIGLNYHTYSNLIIHPWGYDNIQCEDSVLFGNLTREMAKENNYRIGTGMQVLNYNSNGSSDDYMYATTPAKGKILAMTPEVGDWFWPSMDEIKGLCIENVHQNLTVLRALHPMVELKDSTGLFLKPTLVSGQGNHRIRYKITRIGSQSTPASFTVSFVPFGSTGSGLPTLTKTYSNLPIQETLVDSIPFPAGFTQLAGPEKINLEVLVNNGVSITRDTLYHIAGQAATSASLKESCDNASQWQGDWLILTNGQQQGTGYLKPTNGTYAPDMDVKMTRKFPFDLRSPFIKAAEMSLWTKFDVEKNFDYASLEFSTDSGSSWTYVCTDKSSLSSPFSQQAGPENIIPIWDGTQPVWRKEYINLQNFLGKKLWIRFEFHSDQASEFDGFGVDNIEIRTNDLLTPIAEGKTSEEFAFRIFPNPAKLSSSFILSGGYDLEGTEIEIFSSIGKQVYKGILADGEVEVSTQNLDSGCYFVKVKTKSGNFFNQKWLIEKD